MMHKIFNQQQIHKIFLVFFCCCSVIFCCSCSQKEETPQNPNMPFQTETKEITLLEIPQETDLLYLGREGDFDYFIDPVLPQQEIKVAVDKRASQFLNKVYPYTMLQLIYDANNPQEIPEMRIYSISSVNTHFLCGLTTPPGQEDTTIYGKEFLDSFCYNRVFPGLSISDYQLIDAKLEPLDEENHLFSLTITANLIPERTEFQQLGYKWSSYSEKNNAITGQQLSTLLYYYNDKWGCYYNPEQSVPLTEGYKENPIVPQMQYSYQPEETNFDEVFNGKPVQQVFYEDGNYSYLSQTIFVITEKSHDGSTIEGGYFLTQLLQYERETQFTREMTTLTENLLYPQIIGKNKNLAYLATSTIQYPSGEAPGSISRLDLESGTVENMFLNAMPLLATEQEIFVLQLEDAEGKEAGIYNINIADGSFAKVSNLPGSSYSPEHESAFLIRKITKNNPENTEEISYLYLLYPNGDYTRQDFYDLFMINAQTGEITQLQ